MKYVLMFGETRDRTKSWESWPAEKREAAMATVMEWFEKHSGKIRGGHQLQPDRTATTVKFDTGKPIVTDGPFIEGKETIGGYAEIEVPDLDAAIAMAKEWPTGGSVEIRPIIDRGGM